VFGFVKRMLDRRRLTPAVSLVPAELARSFGAADSYTAGQLASVLARTKVTGKAAKYALAANCTEAEFRAARPELSEADYQRLRVELDSLFEIGKPNFTSRHLFKLKSKYTQSFSTISGGDDMAPYVSSSHGSDFDGGH